uniref:Uncharacterized protein n=1 Tax=Lepeophtheirus salmonis TaxID=72036 RepID=A0A0K2TFM4_LEPSM
MCFWGRLLYPVNSNIAKHTFSSLISTFTSGQFFFKEYLLISI